MGKFGKTSIYIDLATAAAVVALLALFFLISRMLDEDKQVSMNENGSQPAAMSPKPPSVAQKEHKEWIKKRSGASAFAEGDKGNYGWTVGYNTLLAAEEDALAYCEQHGAPCTITDTKAGFEHRAFADTIAPATLELYKKYTRLAGAKAFALSPNGAVGLAANLPDAAQARSKAIQTCEANQKDRPAFVADRPCQVVLSTRY